MNTPVISDILRSLYVGFCRFVFPPSSFFFHPVFLGFPPPKHKTFKWCKNLQKTDLIIIGTLTCFIMPAKKRIAAVSLHEMSKVGDTCRKDLCPLLHVKHLISFIFLGLCMWVFSRVKIQKPRWLTHRFCV